jgi:hypothetical protein
VGPAWEKKLREIGDPTFVKPLVERWDRVNSDGIYDPVTWPEPGQKK